MRISTSQSSNLPLTRKWLSDYSSTTLRSTTMKSSTSMKSWNLYTILLPHAGFYKTSVSRLGTVMHFLLIARRGITTGTEFSTFAISPRNVISLGYRNHMTTAPNTTSYYILLSTLSAPPLIPMQHLVVASSPLTTASSTDTNSKYNMEKNAK